MLGSLVPHPGRADRSRRQIFAHRPIAHFRHRIATAALGHQLRDGRARIAEIAEMPRRGGASRHASRNAVPFRQVLVIDPIDAQRAFLHHAAVLVELARAVRTGPRTQLAADAERGIDENDAVLAVAHFERVHAIEPHAPGFGLIGTELRQRPGFAERVPLLAAHHAGVAPDAGIEIDDEPELLGARLRSGEAGHRPPPGAPGSMRASRTIPGGEAMFGSRDTAGNCGSALPTSSGSAFSIRTRRSYHAAWPVTGSQFAYRTVLAAGSNSAMR